MSFGYCEFTQIEAVLRCIRILNNYEMFEKSIQVKPDEKTENFIKEWMELKKNQLDLTSEGKTVESLFEKEDAEVKERLKRYLATIDFRRIKEEKFREEQNKEHYRERERENRRKQYMRDIERKFNDKLKEWLRRDEQKQKDLKKLREKERQKFREKDKLLQKELDYNSSEEKQKIKQMPYKYVQKRKRERKKEREEDELERKHQYELLHPPEPEMPIFRPEDTQEYKNVLMSFQQAQIPLPPGMTNLKENIKQTQFEGCFANDQRMMGDREDSSSSDRYEKEKIKKPYKSTARVTEIIMGGQDVGKNLNNIQIDLDVKNKVQTGNVKIEKNITQGFTQRDDDAMEIEQKQEDKLVNINMLSQQKKQILNEDIKKEFERMIKQIPATKGKLYQYPINWALFAKSGLLERKVKAWLAKKSIEYIGAEEETFIQMIYKQILSQETPEKIEQKVEKVLDEDAEDFVIKMWRMIIFELLKVEAGLA
eukprot:TRINITY_DN1281_c0_g1_i3.p1 TRINITY_DN1281_c0_g1~~TRINITY_DN1281_c0_g1_i3.p1  ORF type:complete len:482 (-),score=108.32 TRINITY_DN1281_c0_g1_i3:64-1509(-)